MYFSNLLQISYFRIKNSSNHSKRTYIHSEEQLELTKSVTIQPKVCSDYQPISVFIHSAANYIERRQTLRNTWVSDLKYYKISVYFVLGLSNNRTIEEIIRTESLIYEDILQFGFIDNYYNNTLKAISILRWINKFCRKPEFILKTDDDVMVNTKSILKNLDQFQTGISGIKFDRPQVERDKKSKWFMPEYYYPEPNYPFYLNGPAYMMTNNITDRLLQELDSYTGYVLDIDDMFITGIIAERAGIERHSSDYIKHYYCSDVCVMYSTAVTYECQNNQELADFYVHWKLTSIDFCQKSYNFKRFLLFSALILTIIGLTICLTICRKRLINSMHGFSDKLNYKSLI